MKKYLSKALPSKVKTMVIYQGTKLSTKFMLSAQTQIKKWLCGRNRKSIERTTDHNKHDKNHTFWNMHMMKAIPTSGNKILNPLKQSSIIKTKICELSFIRQLKLTLNLLMNRPFNGLF